MRQDINGSEHIQVVPGYSNMPYINTASLGAGNLRYNALTRNLEVYDGSTWAEYKPDPVFISLEHGAAAAIQWATEKMNEDKKIGELAKKYPAVKDAKERLDLILALVKDEMEI